MRNKGDILLSVLIFAAIAVTITIGFVNWGASMLSSIRTLQTREQALQIAEAGIDYYRWHLAQSPTDYTDGTTTPAPYYHNFYDKNNNLIGAFSLTITPPPNGSTKVIITSTGTTTANPTLARKIQAILAEPSLAQYAVVANNYMRFGSGTVVNGPVASNRGIHFDGVANNIVSSAVSTDTDPDYDTGQSLATNIANGNCTQVSYGVHTCVTTADPTPPTPIHFPPNDHSTDVFLAGRQFPVPAFPFSGLSVNLNNLHTIADNNVNGGACTTANGPCWKNVSSAGYYGYYIHLNTNNTYDIYKVTNLMSAPNGCTTDNSVQWDTWSYTSLSPKIGTYVIPTAGVIFVEDNLWIDGTNVGQSTSTRVTIAAAATIGQSDPTKYSAITINNNLTYAVHDGSSVIGLIAQGNINVGLMSPDSLQIDSALVAELGRVGRYYYSNSCQSSYARTSLTLNGMIATDFRYGFAYTGSNPGCSNVSSGYCTRTINYDSNLYYSPPPNFPLASTQYQTVSWKQIQ